MSRHDLALFLIERDSPIRHAIESILKNRARTAFVVSQGRLIGSLTEGDILRALLEEIPLEAPVSAAMNLSVQFITSHSKAEALQVFSRNGALAVPVVGEHLDLIDVITLQDCV